MRFEAEGREFAKILRQNAFLTYSWRFLILLKQLEFKLKKEIGINMKEKFKNECNQNFISIVVHATCTLSLCECLHERKVRVCNVLNARCVFNMKSRRMDYFI